MESRLLPSVVKKILYSFMALAAGYCFYLLAIWHLTDGFTLGKIHSDLHFSSKWEVANPKKEEIESLLSLDFYYLGKGSQCFVFESEDKQTILKFFRHERYRVPKISNTIDSPAFLARLQETKKKAKQKKLEDLFKSCKISFEELHEETGLIYLHLNKNTGFKKQITLYDKLKRPYKIDLDEYEFMVQNRGEQIFSYLGRLLKSGRQQEAKEALADLAQLIAIRLQKGIVDHDAVIHKNSGFIGKKALFLDVGSFAKQPCALPAQELWNSTSQIRTWLSKKDPYLAGFFELILRNEMSLMSLD